MLYTEEIEIHKDVTSRMIWNNVFFLSTIHEHQTPRSTQNPQRKRLQRARHCTTGFPPPHFHQPVTQQLSSLAKQTAVVPRQLRSGFVRVAVEKAQAGQRQKICTFRWGFLPQKLEMQSPGVSPHAHVCSQTTGQGRSGNHRSWINNGGRTRHVSPTLQSAVPKQPN